MSMFGSAQFNTPAEAAVLSALAALAVGGAGTAIEKTGTNSFANVSIGGSSSLAGTFDYHRATGSTLNRYYSSPNNGIPLVNSTPTANFMYALALLVAKNDTIDTIQFDVETNGAGSSANIGIYADNGNCYPGALLFDTGSINTASGLGTKSTTLGTPLAVTPGLYWLVFLCSGTAPAVKSFDQKSLLPILGGGSSINASSPQGVGWTVAQTAGALPSTFTAGGGVVTSGAFPYIQVRFV